MGALAQDGTSIDGDCDGGAGWDEDGEGDVSAASSGDRSVPAMRMMLLLGPATAGSGLTNHVVIQLLHVHWV